MEKTSNSCQIHLSSSLDFYCYKCGEIFCHKCSIDHKHTHISRLPKALVSKYEILKYLGSGVSGKVFSCKSIFDGNEYALKLIEIDSDEKLAILEAKKEIEILQKINHQNIIRYFESEYLEDDDVFVIVMELGEANLFEVLKELDQQKSFSYFKQILSAIEYIHKNLGIIHRDLKLANILLKNNQIKICDFGGAKIYSPNETKSMTFFKGTPEYLAPELLNNNSAGKFSEASDVWALGIIFHKMLSNNGHPFLLKSEETISNRDVNVSMIMENIMKNKMILHESIKDPLFINILKQCLIIDSTKRPSVSQLKSLIMDNSGGSPVKISKLQTEPSNEEEKNEEKTLKSVKKILSHDFCLKNNNQKYKIYGKSAKALEGTFNSEADANEQLLKIGPISKLNIEVSSKSPNQDFNIPYLLYLIDDEIVSASKSKLLQISVNPNFCMVEDEWRRFWYNVFYDQNLNPINENGVKYVIQGESDWDNSLNKNQLNEVLDRLEKFGGKMTGIEIFRLILHSYTNMNNTITEKLTKIIQNDLKFNNLKSFELCISSENGTFSVFENLIVELNKSMEKADSGLETFALLINSSNPQNNLLFPIKNLLKRQKNLRNLRLWIGDISADAPFDEFSEIFSSNFTGKLNNLCLGFNSWKLNPSITDYNFELMLEKIKVGMSDNLKTLSLWIWSRDILQKTFNTLYDQIFSKANLDILNFYFEGWFSIMQNTDEWKGKINSALCETNPNVKLGAMHLALYKK